MPAISVIVPVYNVEQYLARCLDSILNQTFTDFEVICVNDGTQDSSGAILQEYAQKDSRITIINQENQGLSMARNNGMKAAQGEYILFVDSDDAIERQLLEIAYDSIIKHQADMACWNFSRSDGFEVPNNFFDKSTIKTTITKSFLLHKCLDNVVQHYVWLCLYKKELIFNTLYLSDLYYEDVPWLQTIALQRPKAVIMPYELYVYTSNKTSISRQQPTPHHIESRLKVLKLSSTILNTPEYQEEFSFIVKNSIHPFLKSTFAAIGTFPIYDQLSFWIAFENVLRDLNEKGLLTSYDKKQKKQFRKYTFILQYGVKAYYDEQVLNWHKKIFHVERNSVVKNYYIRGIKIFSKEKLDLKRRRLTICGITINYTK